MMATKYGDFGNKWWLDRAHCMGTSVFLNLQGHVMKKSIHSRSSGKISGVGGVEGVEI